MRTIAPCLWFNGQALKAAKFYVSLFKKSRILRINRYTKEGHEIHRHQAGSVLTVEFLLEGRKYIALNGGPQFRFSDAISFAVECRTQKEVDWFWRKLSAGGKKGPCGWVKDKFGLSWQVNPVILDTMLADRDRKRAGWVMNAMLKMKKIDIARLIIAYNGKG